MSRAPRNSSRGTRGGRRRARPLPLVAAAVAALLAATAGGTALAAHRGVVLDANGAERTVHTFGGTVADVLDAAGITLTGEDVVAPDPDAPVADGEHVVVRSPRDLTVELDGHVLDHSVHAATLGEALPQIGLDPEAVELSRGRDTPLTGDGLTVSAARAPRMVVMYDTVRTEVRTDGATVADVLDAAGVTPGGHDVLTPAPDAPAEPDMVVRILPVIGEPVTEEAVIEARTVEEEDPDLPRGEREVVTPPVDGLREVVTATVLRDGRETEHELSETIVTEPVDGLVRVGTREPETDAAGGGPAAGLNWAALAECESGGDPSAVNPAGYYGLYQFSPGSWSSVGGTGLPSQASAAEQTRRAQQLYTGVGGNWRSQWPHCGARLFD